MHLVKSYEPPAGQGTLDKRFRYWLHAAEKAPGKITTVNDWRAEHRRGPLYVVSCEVKTDQGWRNFTFRADLQRSLVEPATPAAKRLFDFVVPASFRKTPQLVIKPVSPAAGETPPPGRAAEDVEAVVAEHRGELEALYQRYLANAPELFGTVVVQFIVIADGEVRESNVRNSTTGNDAFDDELATVVAAWAFPANTGDAVIVTYPFKFTTSPE